MGLLLLLGALLCGGAARAEVQRLDRRPEALVEVALPAGARAELPERFPAPGPWRIAATVDGVRTWESALPARTRSLFFHRPPGDVDLVRAVGKGEDPWQRTRPLSHRQGIEAADRADTWEFTNHSLRVRRRIAEGPPGADEYAMGSSVAQEREAALNLGSEGLEPDAARRLALRSMQVDDTTRHGLYLPAPARAVFEVEVPAGARLRADATLLPPEGLAPRESDGAALRVAVEAAGAETELGRWDLRTRAPLPLDLDLGPWAGQRVRLRFETDAGADALLDYAFVAEPRVVVPQAAPPRLVLVFLDTVRADHLPMYGYARDTTPALRVWSEQAALFSQARTVAPWTLPSARTMLTGAQPEAWEQAERLQVRLAREGWATAFLAGNVYLSSNFEMTEGWGTHRCLNWPRASVQVDRARQWLAQQADEPAFLLLHFMDAHLPYHEPLRYRDQFAGPRPAVFDSDGFLRSEVTGAGRRLGEDGRQYVRDRYDNNLRYIDDQLDRLLSSLPADAVVAVVADHGEEFWDHDGFEHGHTLYDELLRVPMILRGPGLTPGVYDAPVSLVDLAPTLLRALGMDAPDATGLALQDLVAGDAEAFAARPLGFGRPLYGEAQWGALADGQKYLTSEGRERVFDLAADPGEEQALPDPDLQSWRFALGAALGRPAGLGFRLVAARDAGSQPTVARLTVPGGVLAAFPAEDPLATGPVDIAVDGETATVTWRTRAGSTPREVFVMPRYSLDQVVEDAALELEDGARWVAAQPVRSFGSGSGGRPTLLRQGRTGGRTVSLGVGVAPLPDAGQVGLRGTDAEVQGDLQALGYVER